MEKIFFLFPGQGAQYTGMALDFLDSGEEKIKNLFELASDVCGRDMKALLRDSDAETLKRTDISQPAITLANLAAAAFLELKFLELKAPENRPAGCAGFSLGEYAAFALAGIISMEDCFSLVNQRGKIMQAAVDRMDGTAGMAAVMGLAPEKVEETASGIKDLYAANFNSPRQTVVSGSALAEAEPLFISAGAKRFIRLAVAGPFHSPLMAEAAEEFRPVLEAVSFSDPNVPFYSNVSGKQVSSGEEAKKLALLHITSPVRWLDVETAIAAAGGINCCLELGPGKVLQGLWRDSPGVALPCFAAGTADEIINFIEGHKA